MQVLEYVPSFPQEMNKYIEAKELCSNLVNFAEWANHLRFQCMRDLTYKTKIIFKGAVRGKQIYHIKSSFSAVSNIWETLKKC